jgi:hypothetical protein
MVVFITIMDILGARMFLALGEARHATYAKIDDLYLTFFWVFTLAIVSFSSLIYYILRRRILETVAVFIAQILFVLSGLEDVLFYLFQGQKLMAVDLSHLYATPAGIVTRILGLPTVTPTTLIANALLFVSVGILLLEFMRQEYEAITVKKAATIIAALLIISISALVLTPYLGVDLTTPLNEKVTTAKEEYIGCKGTSLELEPFRAEVYGNVVSCAIYIRNSGYVDLSTLSFELRDKSRANLAISNLSLSKEGSASPINAIKPGERVLAVFKLSKEQFDIADSLVILPVVTGNSCGNKYYVLARSVWQVS